MTPILPVYADGLTDDERAEVHSLIDSSLDTRHLFLRDEAQMMQDDADWESLYEV